ncbi:hypothetical protein KKC91_12750, partial [bacterium]|nr:hypothetical protein [bacterium]
MANVSSFVSFTDNLLKPLLLSNTLRQRSSASKPTKSSKQSLKKVSTAITQCSPTVAHLPQVHANPLRSINRFRMISGRIKKDELRAVLSQLSILRFYVTNKTHHILLESCMAAGCEMKLISDIDRLKIRKSFSTLMKPNGKVNWNVDTAFLLYAYGAARLYKVLNPKTKLLIAGSDSLVEKHIAAIIRFRHWKKEARKLIKNPNFKTLAASNS